MQRARWRQLATSEDPSTTSGLASIACSHAAGVEGAVSEVVPSRLLEGPTSRGQSAEGGARCASAKRCL